MDYKSYYFMDTENISVSSLVTSIKNGYCIEENSVLILFFNRKVAFAISDMDLLKNHFTDVTTEELNFETPNALDFYIVASMSTLATKLRNKNFHLISSDKGYSPAIDFMKTYLTSNVYNVISTSTLEQTKAVHLVKNDSCPSIPKPIEDKKEIPNEKLLKVGTHSITKSEAKRQKDAICNLIKDTKINRTQLSNDVFTLYYVSQNKKQFDTQITKIANRYNSKTTFIKSLIKAIEKETNITKLLA